MHLRNAVFAAMLASVSPWIPTAAMAQISVSVTLAPPALPVYVQPPVPAPGYIWTPGYWSWSASTNDYHWVPGTWVIPPSVGLLWTPGYWGFADGAYVFRPGYWGAQVGFYGGIDYGFGYAGRGYEGGRWNNGVFSYNTAVSNVNTTVIRNTYHTTVNNDNVTNNRVSYNGGQGGVQARPSPQEARFDAVRHIEPTADQRRHEREALAEPAQRASANRGVPAIAATPHPARFAEAGVVRGGQSHETHGGTPAPTAGDKHEQPPRNGLQANGERQAERPAPVRAEPAVRAPLGEPKREPDPPLAREPHAMPQHMERPPRLAEPHLDRPHGGEGEARHERR